MSSSPSAEERAERQARIEEDIRRLFARYRRKAQAPPPPTRRFTRSRPPQGVRTPAEPPPRG
jgi:hypothetical protein